MELLKNKKLNIMKKKSCILNLIYLAVFWIVISTTIQRFKCLNLTETELFLKIPKSFICDWYYCK